MLLYCPFYRDLRPTLFNKASEVHRNFRQLPDNEKLVILFFSNDMIRILAKTCFTILQKRTIFYTNEFNCTFLDRSKISVF